MKQAIESIERLSAAGRRSSLLAKEHSVRVGLFVGVLPVVGHLALLSPMVAPASLCK
jgi:hypothetical protein